MKKIKLPKIIVALDGMDYADALNIAQGLSKTGAIFKVNDLLDTTNGLQILSDLGKFGEVMDDPKFYDIPKTMTNRVIKHAAFDPKFITIHASNTIEAMRAAGDVVASVLDGSNILGVTVLTSYKTEECEIKLGGSARAKVLQYARDALVAGLNGIVCSGQELKFLSGFSELDSLIRVVPAIRSARHPVEADDQKRIIYIPDAVKLGADYFVIGRPITQADDPVVAFNNLQDEINEAWKGINQF